MIKVFVKKEYKSLKPSEFEIPDFTVLTGKNGSGKSHLMELMSSLSDDCISVLINDKECRNIKYIEFNGLNPRVANIGVYEEIVRKRREIWRAIKKVKDDYEVQRSSNRAHSLDDYLNRFSPPREMLFQEWFNKAGKDWDKLSESFINEEFRFSDDELLFSQIASIFKLYHLHYEENQYAFFRNKQYGEHNFALSEEDFISHYGPKPWDLINEMMQNAHLPYIVNNPIGTRREEDFSLFLLDSNTGLKIQVADLSTGEKVLMSLAIAIYNTKEEKNRPDILLIDEPDAALHPEFSKVLLDAIINSIVHQAKVKVMISSHSPSTVALAPEESVYVMDKDTCKPVKISRKRAVDLLTQKIYAFHVTVDNRRQVFVESRYDVEYYSKIYSHLGQDFQYQPVFLEPSSHVGTNCSDVINTVQSLRTNGNDLVYGIIDFDNKNKSSDYCFVLGENNRYAIDNYIFDPIYLAFLLIHQKICDCFSMTSVNYKYVDLGKLSHDELQSMIDYVIRELDLTDSNLVNYEIMNGDSFYISQKYCSIQGHYLEDLIKKKWPKLLNIAKKQDNLLKNYILDMIVSDYPQFLSIDFRIVLEKIL